MRSLAVIGVGNPFRHDDGIGIRIIELLRQQEIVNCALIDGGTDGLAILEQIKEFECVIIVDAVNMGLMPGAVKVFQPQEARLKIQNDALSTHGFGVAEMLVFAEKLGISTKITIVGIQPQDISFGEGLTSIVASQVSAILEIVQNCLLESNASGYGRLTEQR